MKEGIIILNITKGEAFVLREKGMGEYVKKSYSKHPKYYVVENKTALKELELYRESIRVK